MTMKIDTDVKADLEKLAGEIQAQKGGNVTLSDAVKTLLALRKMTIDSLKHIVREGENGESSDAASSARYLLKELGVKVEEA